MSTLIPTAGLADCYTELETGEVYMRVGKTSTQARMVDLPGFTTIPRGRTLLLAQEHDERNWL